MARAHLHRAITDSSGNVVPNTQVTVYEAGTSGLLVQQLYVNPSGSQVRTNPYSTSDGYVDFYLDRPQSVRIGLAVQGSPGTYVDDLSVLPSPENMVQAAYPFQVLNGSAPGLFLQSGQPGQAAWVDAGDLVNSKPSPLQQIYSYDFSGGTIEDLTIINAAGAAVVPTFMDVTVDPKPLGWEFFTSAIRLPVTSKISARTPLHTWSETGTVIFLYKVVTAQQGVGAAILHVKVDDDLLFVKTPIVADLTNVWMIGYLDKIPLGSHRITIEHRPGIDLDSYVLLGPLWLQYGNNIPAHNHPGTAELSTRLGTGAEAAYARSTAVGAQARTLGADATALGYDSQAALNAVATGALSRAGSEGVAIGHRATTTLTKTGGTAIGEDAVVADDAGIALGSTARAEGPNGIALGFGARAGTPVDAIAIGSNAQALAQGSVALGQGTVVAVGHDYSMAIGKGVATTAARQARIGDSQTTVVIPGSFRQTGGNALFGGPSSLLGFYGNPGIPRPRVLGSRGGNATLASLLTLLADMGLVEDGSTS